MRASTLTTFLFGALLALGPSAAAATTPDCTSTVQGDLRVHMLDSAIFGNTRAIRVLLPAGYDAPENADRRYPVLYLLDGQNVFDACLSEVSRQEWGADEAVQQLVEAGRIPPMIVVGVDHAGRDRAREYLPYKDFVGGPDMDEPAGRQFPDFMVREVMPLVDGRYRTLQGWEHTGIGGSSYGGVASLYALLARPNTFGYGLIESPVLWIGMGQPVRDTSPLVAMPRRVFMAFGGREAADPAVSRKMIGLVRQVESHFHAAGYDASTLRVVIDEDARHDEAAWRQRLPGALEFLFGK
jgi:predicted alpha/beta superfamily hydrolase